MKVSKNDVGKTCLVWYDDVGRIEAMILDVDIQDRHITVFGFDRRSTSIEDFDQILSIGSQVRPPKPV